MARGKKSKVPTPPRAVQAPKARGAERPPRDPRRTRLLLAGAGGIAAIVAIVVVVVLVAGGGDGGGGDGPGEDVAAAAEAAGCVREDFPSQGREHAEELASDFEFNSFPPTSGPHSARPAIYGAYDRPVPELKLVHNLEHGAIVVQYGPDVAQEDVDAIIAWYRADPNGVILAPLDGLGGNIAVTAWTHLMTCSQGFDDAVFSRFRDDYRYKGPEQFPPEALQPGL
jgi:hypothetical protein